MKWGFPYTIKTKEKQPRCKKQRGCFVENDNRLETLRLQGGYLYDKGENDELCYVVGCSATDLQVYFSTQK